MEPKQQIKNFIMNKIEDRITYHCKNQISYNIMYSSDSSLKLELWKRIKYEIRYQLQMNMGKGNQ